MLFGVYAVYAGVIFGCMLTRLLCQPQGLSYLGFLGNNSD